MHHSCSAALQVLAPAVSALHHRLATLEQVLQLELSTSTPWALALVRADVASGCMLFQGLNNLARAALRVVSNAAAEPHDSAHWEGLLRLLGIARDALSSSAAQAPAESRSSWEAKLKAAEDSVRAARLLARLGYPIPPLVIQQSDAAGLHALLRETLTGAAAFVHMTAGTAGPDEVAEDMEADAFAKLWRDARDLHAFGIGRAVPLAKVLEEFVRALLLAQCWDSAERCARFMLEGLDAALSAQALCSRSIALLGNQALSTLQLRAGTAFPTHGALSRCKQCLDGLHSLTCRYLAGTPQVALSKRAAISMLQGAAADVFAGAGAASSTDPCVQAAIRCLALRADTSSHLAARLNAIQALKVAVDELGVPVDITEWHAALFSRSPAPAESSASSFGDPAGSAATLSGSETALPEPAESDGALTSRAGTLAAAKTALFTAAVEQVPSLLAGS